MSFAEMKQSLSVLGFKSLKEYRTSELWKEIRLLVLLRQPDCIVCDRPATQVHHEKYDFATMSGESTDHLAPLCAGCHLEIEFYSGGEKRTDLDAVNAVLTRMMKPLGR